MQTTATEEFLCSFLVYYYLNKQILFFSFTDFMQFSQVSHAHVDNCVTFILLRLYATFWIIYKLLCIWFLLCIWLCFSLFFFSFLWMCRLDERIHQPIGIRIVVSSKLAWKHVRWLHGFWAKKIPNSKIVRICRFCKICNKRYGYQWNSQIGK